MRAFRDSAYMNQNPETIKEFAQSYLQFKDDLNKYSLFVWGYVMLMLDYHKKKNHLANPTEFLDSQSVNRLVSDPYSQYGVPGDIGTINTYGEPGGHYFEEVIMYDSSFPNKQVFR